MTFRIPTYRDVKEEDNPDAREKNGSILIRSIPETPQFVELDYGFRQDIILIDDLVDIVGHLTFGVD